MSSATDEFALIDWIRRQTPIHPRVPLGPGDDTAALRCPGDRALLMTTDMLLEGSCFLREAGFRRIGRKAMNVNLSDIAAMGGVPFAAVVSVALPRKEGRTLATELYLGMKEAAEVFTTAIAGGDTNSWDGPLALSVTLLGDAHESGPVCRSGAKPGDWILTTGSFGGSILNRHLDFTPRVREAAELMKLARPHAMIDISDGLSADLWHICEASGCGAVLFADAIPIHPDAVLLSAQDGISPLQHALSDGEDFELVFTMSPTDAEKILRTGELAGTPVTKIGECVEAGYWIEENGQRRPHEPKGYEHRLEE